MMMQKRMLCLALSTVFSIGTALAVPQDQSAPPQDQGAPPPNGGPQDRPAPNGDRILQAMSRQLNLTDDQRDQIRPIVADEMSQIMGLRNDTSLAPRDRMQKMRSIRDDSNARIKAVLNPDQRTQFDTMQQQQRERMRQRRQGQGQMGGNPASAPEDSNQ